MPEESADFKIEGTTIGGDGSLIIKDASAEVEDVKMEGKSETAIEVQNSSIKMKHTSTKEGDYQYGLKISDSLSHVYGSMMSGSSSDVIVGIDSIAGFYFVHATEVIDSARDEPHYFTDGKIIEAVFDTRNRTLRAEEISEQCKGLAQLILLIYGLGNGPVDSLVRHWF